MVITCHPYFYVKLVISLLAIFFLFYRLVCERNNSRKSGDSAKIINCTASTAFLILLAVLSVGCFFDFELFYKPASIHYPDSFQHYIGSKYFKELGYFNIYNAVVTADAEGDDCLKGVAYLRDLESCYIMSKESILKNAAYYKSKFSSSRWEEFKSDVQFFVKRITPEKFAEQILIDHGYHTSPVWNTTGGIIANVIPAENIIFLTYLDLFLLIIMFVAIFYAFGAETMLIALIFFSINFLSVSVWTRGAFLRYDWLVCLVAALCMINKNRYKTAGVLLSYAAMVKIFPVLFLGGAVIRAGFDFIKNKRIAKKYSHLFGTFILTSLLLFIYGCLYGDGVDNWKNFAGTIVFHNERMASNDVGFKKIFLHDKNESSPEKFLSVYGKRGVHPYDLWAHLKQIQFSRAKGKFLVFSIPILFLFFLLIKKKDDTEAFAWNIPLVFMLLAPACYYYAFFIMFIIIFYKRKVNLISTLHLSLLFAIQAIGYIADIFDDFYIRIYYQLSLAVLVYFVYLAMSELYKDYSIKASANVKTFMKNWRQKH